MQPELVKMKLSGLSCKFLVCLLVISWAIMSAYAVPADKIQEIVASSVTQEAMAHLGWFLAVAGSYLVLTASLKRRGSLWDIWTDLPHHIGQQGSNHPKIITVVILLTMLCLPVVSLLGGIPAAGLVVLLLLLVVSGRRREITLFAVLTALATLSIFFLIGTLYWMGVYRASLWLTPFDEGNVTYVKVPLWLLNMTDNHIPYNDTAKEYRRVKPGDPPDHSSPDLWNKSTVLSAYRYYRFVVFAGVTLASVPSWIVEWSIEGWFTFEEWFIPLTLGFLVAVLTYSYLIEQAPAPQSVVVASQATGPAPKTLSVP